MCLWWYPALIPGCVCIPSHRVCNTHPSPGFLCVCSFAGFLLWVRIAYACPTTASLCNKAVQHPVHCRGPSHRHAALNSFKALQIFSTQSRCPSEIASCAERPKAGAQSCEIPLWTSLHEPCTCYYACAAAWLGDCRLWLVLRCWPALVGWSVSCVCAFGCFLV